MTDWLLTDEEITRAAISVGPAESELRGELCRAQLRKVVKQMDGDCPHDIFRWFCSICRDELRKEAGMEDNGEG